jgi:hypothetical protein
MEKHELQSRLKRLIADAESILREMAPDIQPVASQSLGICRYCKEPLFPHPRPIREVHSHCYHQIRHSEKSLEEHVALGLLGPAKSGGRPKTVRDKAAEIATQKLNAAQSVVEQSLKKNKAKKD